MARHGKKKIRFGSGGKKIEDFVDPDKDPHSYLKRFILEENYRDWFNRNYPDSTIYDAVGLNEWDYNEMEKKLSPDQDTTQDTTKNEPFEIAVRVFVRIYKILDFFTLRTEPYFFFTVSSQ